MDQDSTLMLLMNYLLKMFDITIKTEAPYNNQSLQAEYCIVTVHNINERFRSIVAKILAISKISIQYL